MQLIAVSFSASTAVPSVHCPRVFDHSTVKYRSLWPLTRLFVLLQWEISTANTAAGNTHNTSRLKIKKFSELYIIINITVGTVLVDNSGLELPANDFYSSVAQWSHHKRDRNYQNHFLLAILFQNVSPQRLKGFRTFSLWLYTVWWID